MRRAEDVERAFPFAVATARAYREVFGDGVKLAYAANTETGEKLGKPSPAGASSLPSPSATPAARPRLDSAPRSRASGQNELPL